MFVPCQIPPKARSTVTGCTEYSGTRPPAPATGPAGTEPPPSSSVSVGCSTTRRLTPVTGLRTLPAARSIVILFSWSGHPPWLTLFPLALCKDDANGNVPLGKSCNRYWACQGGYPRLQRCPAMLVFDKNRRRCVTPPTEDCEGPTSKAPPPDYDYDYDYGGLSTENENRVHSGQRRPSPPRPEPLPFNLPPGAVPLNEN